MLNLHHIAIQTNDMSNTARWYRDFFEDCEQNWELDRFSELTRSRLPGIARMVELQLGALRLHIFEREGVTAPADETPMPLFQHCGLLVEQVEDLTRLREHALTLGRSGAYKFERVEPPSEVVFDSDGVGSLYVLDPNGLEFEFTFVPPASKR